MPVEGLIPSEANDEIQKLVDFAWLDSKYFYVETIYARKERARVTDILREMLSYYVFLDTQTAGIEPLHTKLMRALKEIREIVEEIDGR